VLDQVIDRMSNRPSCQVIAIGGGADL